MTADQPLPAELVPRAKPVKLTPARRRALDVLAERHAKGRCARVSNVTDPGEGLVYWQSAEWLVGKSQEFSPLPSTGMPSRNRR